jgi:hypothetical protein
MVGAWVRVVNHPGGAPTDDSGHFDLRTDLSAGTYVARALFIGYQGAWREFTVSAAGVIDIGVLVLKRQTVEMDDFVVSCPYTRMPQTDSAGKTLPPFGHDSLGLYWVKCH